MCDEWMPGLNFRLSREEFYQLPRNPAFKYEYLDHTVYLTPRPRHFHGLLELADLPLGVSEGNLPQDIQLRPVQEKDRLELVSLFAASFYFVQPFGSLSDEQRQEAAGQCLEKTFTGGDGPLITQASFVAVDAHHHPRGALLLTLLPEGDPTSGDDYFWQETPPADCLERRLGRPHLTWVFVDPMWRGGGLGSALLAKAGQSLHKLGFTQLLSTFLLGNDTSLLWHWRNGFQLLPYPGSKRLWRQQKLPTL